MWSENERVAFINWIAAHPMAGDVIPGADGARKVRWNRSGSGKSGGVRVIYFHLPEQDALLLVAMYAKSDRNTMIPVEISKVI